MTAPKKDPVRSATFRTMQSIFDQASALPGELRRAYLDDACKGDTTLREEIEEMLESLDTANHFLKDPTVHPQSAHASLDDIRCGMTIGNAYRLLEKIGEGASANVYMAEQMKPVRRRVAMKIIKLGMDTAEVIARFDAEKQALAMMDHPNIAKVFDAGATETGRPYFIMELVKGIAITEYCDKNHLTLRERLELFVPVCHALQHAHLKGVIHRDLKPNNILVTLHDGMPVPKVIDFGIAKATETRLTDKTLFTKFHQFVGTPAYMSPEQAEMSGLDVDTRSDVYGLGVLVYELITGSTPFDSKELLLSGLDGMRKVIITHEPPTPSTRLDTLGQEGLVVVAQHRRLQPGELNHHIRGELDWIVMRALEKDRTRRYQSAMELARDLQRYLDNEPVEAGPPDNFYRMRKLIVRHRGLVVASALVLSSLLVGLVLATTSWKKAETEATLARQQAKRADTVSQLLYGMFESANPGSNKGAQYTVRQLLDDASQNLESSLRGEPETEFALRQILARAYHGLGAYLEAEGHWRRARELAVSLHGKDSAAEASIDVRLGWTLHEMGHQQQAQPMITEGLKRQEALLGNEALPCLESRGYLVELLRQRGEWLNAEQLAEETLATYTRHPEAPSAPRRWLLQTLARLYRDQGRTDLAEKVSHELLSDTSEGNGQDTPQTLLAIHTLAESHLAAQRLTEGEELVRRGLDSARRLLGENQPTTLTLRRDLAAFRAAAGFPEEAARILETVLDAQRDVLGEAHPDTLQTTLQLIPYYQRQERTDDAMEMARTAMHVSQDQLGAHHAMTYDSIDTYVKLMMSQKRFEKLEPTVIEALKVAEETLGRGHPVTARQRLSLGEVYLETSRPIEAEDMFRQVLLWHGEHPQPRRILLDRGRFLLGRCLFEQRRHLEAERQLESLLKELPDTAEDFWEAKALLGRVQLRRWELINAHETLSSAWSGLKSSALAGNENAWVAGFNLGECLYMLGWNREAIAFAEDFAPEVERVLGASSKIAKDSKNVYNRVRDQQSKDQALLETLTARFQSKQTTTAPARFSALQSIAETRLRLSDYANLHQDLKQLQGIRDSLTPPPAWMDATILRLNVVLAECEHRTEAVEAGNEALLEMLQKEVELSSGMRDAICNHVALYEERRGKSPRLEERFDAMADRAQDAVWSAEDTRLWLPRDAVWRLLYDRVADPDEWTLLNFDDTDWETGMAPLGHSIRQLGTYINTAQFVDYRPVTTFYRKTFDIVDLSSVSSVRLRLRRNDGAVVYINGREVVRDNLPEGVFIDPETRALKANSIEDNYRSSVFIVDPSMFREGTNVAAVEVHQWERPTSSNVFNLAIEALVKP